MKICLELDINFVIPTIIIQDASHSEANAAISFFGPNIVILMCWFHMIFNVKKHESLKEVPPILKDMVITDLTRLHYCLEYEYETFKKLVFDKWNSYPELKHFIAYVIPQWFEGTFCNWHIFKSPPGFANTNNPMESFNKIIKARFRENILYTLKHFFFHSFSYLMHSPIKRLFFSLCKRFVALHFYFFSTHYFQTN